MIPLSEFGLGLGKNGKSRSLGRSLRRASRDDSLWGSGCGKVHNHAKAVTKSQNGEGFFDCVAAVPQERDGEKSWPPFRSE